MVPETGGGSFGFRTTARIGVAESRADEFLPGNEDAPDLFSELDGDVAVRLATFSIGAAWHLQTAYDCGLSGEAEMVINHFTNDMSGLFTSVGLCDGRSAARAARALFEHVVNFCDVASDETARARYIAQGHVTADRLADYASGVSLLRGSDRRKERDRLRRLKRDAARPLAQAFATYGYALRGQWHPKKLSARADAYGLGRGYEGYRILSGVLHGSSGSLSGTLRIRDGHSIHRTGPDLELTAFSLLEGLNCIREMANRLAANAPDFDPSTLVEQTELLISDWPHIQAVLRRLDRRLWASAPTPVSVLAIYPSGARWYVHDRQTQELFLAETPEVIPFGEDLLWRRVAEIRREFSTSRDGRPLTISVAGVRLRRRPGLSPVHAASILDPGPLPSD